MNVNAVDDSAHSIFSCENLLDSLQEILKIHECKLEA